MHSTIESILRNDSQRLQAALNLDSGSARIEVQCLLQSVLRVDRAWLLGHPEQSLDVDQHARYMVLFERRLNGEPVAYLLGEREFYGLKFKVSPATLIPRPETELLVELALERLPQRGHVLDLGTGSGAIAMSIAHARPDARVTAVEASQEALEVAQENLTGLDLDNVCLLQGDWFAALHGESYDIIVSNPPYVAAGDLHLQQGDLRFEPVSALSSGDDGLDDIRSIIAESGKHLRDNGWLLLEHGYRQAPPVLALLEGAGFGRIFTARDLSGIERVSGGTRPAPARTAG